MKYKTFSLIIKVALISIPILFYFFVIRSCVSKMTNAIQQEEERTKREALAAAKDTIKAAHEEKADSQELSLSSIQREILQLQKQPISTGKPDGKGSLKRFIVKDDIKIDMRCDKTKGFTTWNRLKIDLDGDKKYDEKWNFRDDGTVARFVAPDDDENYTVEYRLTKDVWKLK